jgi:hypothetical protein
VGDTGIDWQWNDECKKRVLGYERKCRARGNTRTVLLLELKLKAGRVPVQVGALLVDHGCHAWLGGALIVCRRRRRRDCAAHHVKLKVRVGEAIVVRGQNIVGVDARYLEVRVRRRGETRRGRHVGGAADRSRFALAAKRVGFYRAGGGQLDARERVRQRRGEAGKRVHAASTRGTRGTRGCDER